MSEVPLYRGSGTSIIVGTVHGSLTVHRHARGGQRPQEPRYPVWGRWVGGSEFRKNEAPPWSPAPPGSATERLVFCCRATSASTAPCTSRRMYYLTHCASYCAPCQPEVRHLPRVSGAGRWVSGLRAYVSGVGSAVTTYGTGVNNLKVLTTFT